MLLTTLLSFLGGSTFRMLWGEISSFISRAQDHKLEIERLKIEREMAAEQHARNLEAIKVQHELGIQVVRVQAEADIGRTEAAAWASAVEGTTKTTGIWLVDLWNGVIRPLLATTAIVMWVGSVAGFWTLSESDLALVGSVLGIYVADRTLFKRGK